MLVQTEEAYKEISGFFNTPECFYCGETVSPPMIVWSGTTSSIVFHPDCAATFQIVFARDLYEVKSWGKVLVFEEYLSPEEKLKAHKEAQAYMEEIMKPYEPKISQNNVQLTVERFHFIDGGSEKAHIIESVKDKYWYDTRCGHHFKQFRVMEARELDSGEVCYHCVKQGGVKIYPTGNYKKWDDSTWPPTWKIVKGDEL